jgi:hypothetical protein
MDNTEASRMQAERYNAVVARAWTQPEYKARLLAEPARVLGEAGIDLPSGKSLRVVEVGKNEVYVVLPAQLDAETRARVRQAPAAALAEAGVKTDNERPVHVLEEDETHGYVFLPPKPEAAADEVQGYMNIANLNMLNLGGGANVLMGGQSGSGLNMLTANMLNLGGGANVLFFNQSTS